MTAADRPGLPLLCLALAFGWLAAVSLSGRSGDASAPLAMAVLSTAAALAYVWLERFAPQRDPLLLPAAVLLTAFGLSIIARVAPNFLARQSAWVVVGMIAMCAVAASRDRLRWLWRFKYTWLIAALALLGLTLFYGVNPGGTGAPLWLAFAGLFLQPSEVLRLLMIAFLAAYYGERIQTLEGRPTGARGADLPAIAPPLVMSVIALALLLVQQDLGAGALLLTSFLFMLYLATGRAVWSLGGLAALIVAVLAGALVSSRVALRLAIWRDPFGDSLETSFQIAQSLMTVASGGVFGQGMGQGFPAFVPAVHTDFPFVAVAEELGLLGGLALLAAFAVIILRAWRTAQRSPSPYGLLLAGGLAASFVVQVTIILGGNLALLPLTGVTLPFVSYGGSSLLVSFVALGLIIRLSADAGVPRGVADTHRRAAERSAVLSAALLATCAAGALYWGVLRSSELVARDDNPRRVLLERALRRGDILAADGTPLVTSLPAAPDQSAIVSRLPVYIRRSAQPAAAPATGYYSLRHGSGGLEEAADGALRGERSVVDVLLHRAQHGQAVTTTLDTALQLRLVGAFGRAAGAAVVVDGRTGAIRAMVSAPYFDPNTLDEDWDRLRADVGAPLLNRAVDGRYPVGGAATLLSAAGLTTSGVITEGGRASPLDVAAALIRPALISPTLLAGELPLARAAVSPDFGALRATVIDGEGSATWLLAQQDGMLLVAVVEGAAGSTDVPARILEALPIMEDERR